MHSDGAIHPGPDSLVHWRGWSILKLLLLEWLIRRLPRPA